MSVAAATWTLPGVGATRRAVGQLVHVMSVRPDGQVLITAARVKLPRSGTSPARVRVVDSTRITLGWVDPSADFPERSALRVLAAAGWRKSGEWALTGRIPSCRVVRTR